MQLLLALNYLIPLFLPSQSSVWPIWGCSSFRPRLRLYTFQRLSIPSPCQFLWGAPPSYFPLVSNIPLLSHQMGLSFGRGIQSLLRCWRSLAHSLEVSGSLEKKNWAVLLATRESPRKVSLAKPRTSSEPCNGRLLQSLRPSPRKSLKLLKALPKRVWQILQPNPPKLRKIPRKGDEVS